jgi:hypothetical protein
MGNFMNNNARFYGRQDRLSRLCALLLCSLYVLSVPLVKGGAQRIGVYPVLLDPLPLEMEYRLAISQ